jgi:hypothetical protein
MTKAQLARYLQRQHIDPMSLAPILTRSQEVIYGLTVPRPQALDAVHSLQALSTQSGYWPVLGWEPRWWEESEEYRTQVTSGSTAALLEEATRISPEDWLAQQQAGEPTLFSRAEVDLGPWPEASHPQDTLWFFQDAAMKGQARLPLALVPATRGWQVPAVVRFDAGMVAEAVHVALLKRWQEAYGAEVVVVLPDVLELQVQHPPATRAAAFELAWEQYLYCPDIVIQGTQTLSNLAASLLNASIWFFWWD